MGKARCDRCGSETISALATVLQMAVLAAVGDGGVQAQQRRATACFFDIDGSNSVIAGLRVSDDDRVRPACGFLQMSRRVVRSSPEG
jgi:hypothetical protein